MATPRTKIFVGHLPDGCRSEDLQMLFEKHGSVKECDVINKYGFVHMSSPDEADAAIKALNNYDFMGSRLSVEQSKSKLHPEPGASGRAKGGMGGGGGGMGGGRRGMGQRNGYGSMRGGMNGGYGGGYSNGFNRRYDDAPYGDPYAGERSYGYGGGFRERSRPYPTPYERRPMGVPPMRDEYSRPLPPPPATRDPYAARMGPSLGAPRSELYERRPSEMSDYLYSRRSPQPSMSSGYHSFGDSYGESDGRSFAARSSPYSSSEPSYPSRGAPPPRFY